jgi:hypothetical protein
VFEGSKQMLLTLGRFVVVVGSNDVSFDCPVGVHYCFFIVVRESSLAKSAPLSLIDVGRLLFIG